MIGERESNLNETQYGDLVMRSYDISGNEINAFYDESDDLVFVLDNTINQTKPNVLLVINPDGDKKWDEILSGQYDVDLETIRPKQDNKYQKLDIEYSGLSVYDKLIDAYTSGEDISEHLKQLNILRDSAARHSAMMRLNVANDVISKTNVTIVKTKETIVRLQERIKTLRAKLSSYKKEIGKVSTKQSASKILKVESQIEAANEKLKRAKKRLDSAQKRLEVATVDAELASGVLNQPALEMDGVSKKSKPVMVAPKHELKTVEPEDSDDELDEVIDEEDDYEEEYDEDDEISEQEEIKPLFDKDPQILNDDIAFKPISLNPALESTNTNMTEPVFEPRSVLESMTPIEDNEQVNNNEIRPVLESMTPIENEEKPVVEQPLVVQPIETQDTKPVAPVATNTPVAPVVPPVMSNSNVNNNGQSAHSSKPSLIYYILLFVLICLSVFTLWLYQKKMGDTEPVLTKVVKEQVVASQSADEKPVAEKEVKTEEEPQQQVEETPTVDIVSVNSDYFFEDDEEPVKEKEEKQSDKEDAVADEESKEVEETPAPTEDNSEAEETVETETETESEAEVVAGEEEQATQETESTDVIEETEQSEAPVVEDAVPEKVMTSGMSGEDEEVSDDAVAEEDVDKPEYEAGSKHDEMFVSETGDEEAEESDEDFYEE